ncbi:hypothetical protein FH972_021896 [Carpinus fangiana]|uniref:adenosine deaminase n=1 Tax=Carpinus fangiana TaxID=176857 RepID=A0A5N6KQN0_9ROSI|nr:hypothetical protein FH972_021896 [Carpinus fangiana]
MANHMSQDSSLEEDEQWARDEGIPSLSDPFIQKYFQGVDTLIDQENKHRSDKDFRELLSPMAQEACAIVNQIRFAEQQTLWTTSFEDSLAHETRQDLYPGMMFTLAKERIESSKLWQIVRKMPKGTLLHCHLEAMVDLEWVFNEALKTPGMHISAAGSLYDQTSRDALLPVFQYRKTPAAAEISIWSESYKPNTWVSVADAAASFPDGGKLGFLAYLMARCSITPAESLRHHYGPNDIWDKFTKCFLVLDTVLYYEPILRAFLQRMFTQLVDDGVRYVDIRAAFAFNYYKEGSQLPEDGYSEVFRVLNEELEKFQSSPTGKDFWGARMIWTTIRSFSDRDIIASMKECIAIKEVYPHLIAGFDLVGHEDGGRSLSSLVPVLFWFRKACAQSGVGNIPFFFHAGETLGTGSDTDLNLFDAVLLGTRRIGHGFSLYKHPLLMNMVRDKRLCVECCPISNEVLRLTHSISSHPLPALLAQGVPVALCNDDPGILGQGRAGMSHDFWQALQGIESLGLEGLGSLAENSVRWAAFEDQDTKEWTEDIKNGAYGTRLRAQRMKEWKKDWERFCQWVVMEFGVDMDGDLEE